MPVIHTVIVHKQTQPVQQCRYTISSTVKWGERNFQATQSIKCCAVLCMQAPNIVLGAKLFAKLEFQQRLFPQKHVIAVHNYFTILSSI